MYQDRESSFVTQRALILLAEKIRDSSVPVSVQDVKATIKACQQHCIAVVYHCHLVAVTDKHIYNKPARKL